MSYVEKHESALLSGPDVSVSEPGDYVALLKPRVMSLVVLTALAGLLAAPGHTHPLIGFVSLLAIAVGAGASGALNMWYDADIDAIMSRTRTRPIPGGRIAPGEALAFGLILSAFSVFTLGLVANWLAASLLAFTIFFYVVIYSMLLKRSTPQNIVIGGAAGAFPPMVGYAASSGMITLESVILFAIIFVWTPPHFWALALVKSGDYQKAGIPMMPNVRGPAHTRLEILIYSILLAPLAVTPWLLGFASAVYGVLSIVGGVGFVYLASRVYRITTGPAADKAAMTLFWFSILYLFLLFGVIVVENGLAAIFAW